MFARTKQKYSSRARVRAHMMAVGLFLQSLILTAGTNLSVNYQCRKFSMITMTNPFNCIEHSTIGCDGQ